MKDRAVRYFHVMEKFDARKLSRVELRTKREEVIRLRQEGMPLMKIVAECGLSWPAVNATIKRHEAGGVERLVPLKRGRKPGTGRALSEDQENELRKILYRKRPWQVGLKQPARNNKLSLWNRDAIAELIGRQCAVTMTARGVAKYLRRWGFPATEKSQWQKQRWGFPAVKNKRLLTESCSREIQGWLKERYADLDRQYKDRVAEIFWVSRKRMAVCDEEKSSQKLSLVSAVDSHGKERWLVVKGHFTQEKQVNFLKGLINETRKQAIVIRNNADYFMGRQVVDWLRVNEKAIRLFPPLLPMEIRKKEAERANSEMKREGQKFHAQVRSRPVEAADPPSPD